MSSVRTTSGIVALAGAKVRTAAGLQAIAAMKVRDASGLHDVLQTMKATASPANVYGTGRSGGTIAVTTTIATCTPVGGTAPFTFAWTSGGGDMTAVASTSQSTSFSALLAPGEFALDTFTCTVTDANGAIATSPIVHARAQNIAPY